MYKVIVDYAPTEADNTVLEEGVIAFNESILGERARQEGYDEIGIGVGLYMDYGPAQRLYFQLGYIPDGNGITYKGQPTIPGQSYLLDDDLILWLTKTLTIES